MEPARLIDMLGGVATRQQLIERGCSGYDLTVAVRRGLIRRVRQARYITSRTPFDVAAAARVGGLLAGPSAARSYGLWAGFDSRLHVSVGNNSARLRTNTRPSLKAGRLTVDRFDREVVIHWLRGGAVPERGANSWRVSLPTCLRQMVAWTDRETAVACLDTAITVFDLSPASISTMFAGEADSHRVIASGSRTGSDSGPESVVRQRLMRVGIVVVQQFTLAGVGRFDMWIPGSSVLIEVDGRQYHDTPDQYEHDRWRDAEAARRGFVVIRLSFQKVFGDWDWCERAILDALALPSFRSLGDS